MHIVGHALSAVPFLIVGDYWAAFGAVLPDVTWIKNEWRFRRSGIKRWHDWIDHVPERWITPYRIAHSLWLPLAVASFAHPITTHLALGWLVHLFLDQPTHSGRMTQQPLYPLRWRFPWHI
jgi:hypothetical protein